MGLLTITPQEWQDAEQFFRDSPKKIKKPRDKTSLPAHSFIKTDAGIFAVANARYEGILGVGGLGLVKVVQNQLGENFAIKVEAGETKKTEDQRAELKIMKMINFLKTQVAIDLDQAKNFWKSQPDKPILLTNKKIYTITELREGKELFDLISQNYYTPFLTDKQKILIALKCCLCIQGLHDLGIIHADIKPENFMANLKGEQIIIGEIDYGFSMTLEMGEHFKITTPKGSANYTAPEILNRGHFSFASDVFALGKTLFYLNPQEVGIIKLFERMCDPNPHTRITLLDTIEALSERLKTEPDLTDADKQLYNTAKKIFLDPQAELNKLAHKIGLTWSVSPYTIYGINVLPPHLHSKEILKSEARDIEQKLRKKLGKEVRLTFMQTDPLNVKFVLDVSDLRRFFAHKQQLAAQEKQPLSPAKTSSAKQVPKRQSHPQKKIYAGAKTQESPPNPDKPITRPPTVNQTAPPTHPMAISPQAPTTPKTTRALPTPPVKPPAAAKPSIITPPLPKQAELSTTATPKTFQPYKEAIQQAKQKKMAETKDVFIDINTLKSHFIPKSAPTHPMQRAPRPDNKHKREKENINTIINNIQKLYENLKKSPEKMLIKAERAYVFLDNIEKGTTQIPQIKNLCEHLKKELATTFPEVRQLEANKILYQKRLIESKDLLQRKGSFKHKGG